MPKYSFYLPDEDRSVGWTNHAYVLQFVCDAEGSDPEQAWRAAVVDGNVPDAYDLRWPPTIAIEDGAEQRVDLPELDRDQVRRARAIELTAGDLQDLIDVAEKGIDGDSNDAEHDALYQLHEQLVAWVQRAKR